MEAMETRKQRQSKLVKRQEKDEMSDENMTMEMDEGTKQIIDNVIEDNEEVTLDEMQAVEKCVKKMPDMKVVRKSFKFGVLLQILHMNFLYLRGTFDTVKFLCGVFDSDIYVYANSLLRIGFGCMRVIEHYQT